MPDLKLSGELSFGGDKRKIPSHTQTQKDDYWCKLNGGNNVQAFIGEIGLKFLLNDFHVIILIQKEYASSGSQKCITQTELFVA